MKKLLLSLFAVLTASFAFGQTNLLNNASFEEWTDEATPASWTTESTAGNATLAQSTDAKSGSYAVEIKGKSSSNVRLGYKETALKAGTYTYTIYAKAAEEGAQARMGYVAITDGKPGTYNYAGSNPVVLSTTEWTALTQEFTLTETTTICLVLMNSKNGNGVSVLADDASLTTTNGGISDGDDPEPAVSIANTPETAYTATEAVALIDAGQDLNTKVYVKGIISEIKSLNTSQYQRAQYYISEDGTTANQFYIYNGYYLGGADFTADDQIKVGDQVIVYGQLTKYGETYEMAQNSEIYELNGQHAEQTTAEKKTIAEVQALETNIDVLVENAVVYAICKNGAVFGDGTGYIYYYDTAVSGTGIAVGDKVTIEGKPTTYGGFKQFTNAANITKTGTASVSYPSPVEIDVDAWLAAPSILYVKLSGTLSISGNYYNLVVDGATAQGSIIGAQDDLFSDVANGSAITIEGFAMYTSGGKYVNIVATKVTVDGQGEQVDITNTPETAYSIAKAIELINAGKGLEQAVYVKGIISEIVSLDVSRWPRAQYDITETADSEQKLRIYNGYYLQGEAFTANDQIKVGDEVVVYGQLTKYNDLYEMAQNNVLYSLNGVTDGIDGVKADVKAQGIYDLTGRRVENATKGIYIVNGKKVVIK